MAGFISYDDLITELTVNGKSLRWDFYKDSSSPEAAGVWHSDWVRPGSPGAGVAPATTPGTAYTNDAGSMFWADTSTDTKHLVTVGATATQNCTLMIYDRLVAVSGISLVGTGSKTVNSTTLPRYATGAGVQAWLEVTTQTATTAAIVNLNSYTNVAGTTGRTGGSITFPATATNVDTLVGPLPMQAGDTGIKSIEAGLNVATAASAGVVNVVLLRPLAHIPLVANQWNERDMVLQLAALDRVYDGASLAIAFQASTTSATSIWGTVRLAYG